MFHVEHTKGLFCLYQLFLDVFICYNYYNIYKEATKAVYYALKIRFRWLFGIINDVINPGRLVLIGDKTVLLIIIGL